MYGRFLLGVLVSVQLFWPILWAAPEDPQNSSPTPEQINFFEKRIRPVLVRECYGCHSSQVGQVRGGLWLDTADALRTGGDSGPAVVPGNVAESLLWNALNHADFAMPPGRKLPDHVLADFRLWIEMGAPDPRIQEKQQIISGITAEDLERGRDFWSFQVPVRPAVPGSSGGWGRTELDEFVWDKLAENGLSPAPDAEPVVLLRRLYFDLIGLPPGPDQVKRFADAFAVEPDAAIRQTIDYLLAQPAFGERWARHWLDVARYAESSGREPNITFPTAWRYRDYVIRSFNQDKPYDRFLQEQIAGDLLPVETDEQWSENLVATGFLAIGPKALTEQNPRQFEWDLIDEQIDVTTRVMLGLSISCARCHDHKFDPITQTDYYAMAGIFRSTTTHYGTFRSLQNRRPSNLISLPISDPNPFDQKISKEQREMLLSELASKRQDLQAALFARRQRQQGNNTGSGGSSNSEQNSGGSPRTAAETRVLPIALLSATSGILEALLDNYDETGRPLTLCMAVQDQKPVTTRLLERGEFNRPAQIVERGLPQVLCSVQPELPEDSSGRLELAQWIGSSANPLTARVMVNRIWQHLMGHGIVRTPEDFGATGQMPSHPEMLDHLAVDFMENGWSVKHIIRTIASSRIYRTSNQFDSRSFEIDPENALLWRREPKRLDAESIRDSMLAIGGNLDSKAPRASLVARVGPAVVRDGRFISSRIRSESWGKNRSATGGEGGNLPTSRIPNRMASATSNNSRDLSSLIPFTEPIDQPANFRSIYLPIVRDNVPRSLDVFDFAESTMVIGKRETSSTPDQGLYMMNNAFVIEQADSLAARIIRQTKDPREQIKLAFQLAFSRHPSPKEMRMSLDYYRSIRDMGNSPSRSSPMTGDQLSSTTKSDRRQSIGRASGQGRDTSVATADTASGDLGRVQLSRLCQALMASAEFRYLD